MRGVQEVGEEKADELEGHAYHSVPDEAEDGADGEAVDIDVVGPAEAGGEDCGFPVRRGGVGCGLFVGLREVVSGDWGRGGRDWGRTGGCSSTFSPLSGFALRFANTPSDPEPPPYTLPVPGGGVSAGNCVTRLWPEGGRPSLVIVVVVTPAPISSNDATVVGVPLINRCLSSPSFSSSLSAPSASNVSANVWSTTVSCLEEGEEVRDRKDGGGEVGIEVV